ncbi:MAG TPA: family 16 glycosylhydrolase, partial [Kineobactrum sp.]
YRTLLVGSLLVLSACGGGNNDPAQGGELANPVAPTSGDWRMVWEDSFDGDALDPANWEIQLGDGTAEGIPGWGNNELQYYAAENIRVSDGNLIIEARADSVAAPGFDFTSGRIRTQGKVDFTYGRIEARIQVPAGQGLWSAFWLLGSDPSIYGEWAAKGEIDIMEKFLPDFFTSAVHFGSVFPQNEFVSQAYDGIDPTDGFHTYAVEWDAERIRFFVDGENFYTVGADTYYNYYFKNSEEGFVEGGANAPFNENQHILLNMAVGGNLPGNPGDLSVFPAQMLVDYVRVYECPIDPATGLGCEDSIDPVNPFITFEVPADAPVVTRSTLYDDALAPLFAGTDTERVIDFGVFDNSGALILSEVARDTGGMAIDIRTSGGGNVSIVDPNGGTFRLVNMGSAEFPGSSADFKFDIKVISGADTNPEGMLQVRIDSGFPDVAFTELAIADLPQDEWGQVSVPLRDILTGGAGAFGGQPVNVNALASLITFEPTSAAHLRIDNLRLDCGGTAFCGIESRAVTPLAVFDEGVNDTTWTRGINGFDTEIGGDYSDGAAGNHVSWELVDTGEEGFGVVIETTFDASGASGVSFIGSEQPVDLSAWAEGELAFDVRVLSNPNDNPMIYKVDNPGGLGTGDQSLGLLP